MTLSKQDLRTLCEIAKTTAIEAGIHIQSLFDEHYDKGMKKGVDSIAAQVVTEVDIKAQEIILEGLKSTIKQYDLGVLTEEAVDDQSRLEKDYFWCIDPMDGTLPFTEGRTGYAVSIALITKVGNPVIGVVYIPDLDECYSSVKGMGVLLNDKPLIRNNGNSEDTLHVFIDTSLKKESYFESLTDNINEWFDKKYVQTLYHNGFGAVCNAIGVMNSISGCYFKLPKEKQGGGSIWDFAATHLFFEELSLCVSNGAGNILNLNNANSTFMNEVGIIFATDEALSSFLIETSTIFSS
ncbi:3'(2'),5'-bisphosphate nucleotidase CysQ family protein [Fulvivirga lutimaris]|uniref:3'(2'),5'-bisphosphate nucleotidase CysQ family protein n=1 Tax=Fulvivirga lutimaris TaxID=1819566 RepID=UPI0012BD1F62|nr:inositol monophosphatase family protein [Fulvivirga lutimaris]MTI39542.1 inositol monophosphatase family protein [Fulvivirga lutimaris]